MDENSTVKILITGCTGLIGGHVYKYLSNRSFDVYGTCFNSTTDTQKKLFKLDLTSKEESKSYLSQIKPDIIIHAAAVLPNSHNSEETPIAASKNFLIDKHVTDYCQQNNAYLVYLSSAYVYNRTDSSPFPLSESSPIFPEGEYLNQKFLSEKRIIRELKKHLILRLSSPFGMGMRKRVMKTFLNKAINNENITLFGAGEKVQDFIYVKNIGLIVEELILKEIFGVFNLVSGKSISMKDLAILIINLTKSNSELIFEQSEAEFFVNNNFSNKKLISVLDNGMKYDLHDGIVDMLLKNENRNTF